MLLWTLGCMHLFQLVSLLSLEIYAGKELLDHMVVQFSVIWEISVLFFRGCTPIYIPTNCVGGFPFFLYAYQPLLFKNFCDTYSDMYELISHHSINSRILFLLMWFCYLLSLTNGSLLVHRKAPIFACMLVSCNFTELIY